MSKRKVPTAPCHLLTTEPTLAQHKEAKRTLHGAFNEPVREYGERDRVDNSANYVGSKDKTSVAERRANASIRGDKEASEWLKRHKWGLQFA